MIPKIIHYCWFGRNPLPELAQRCIASWKKYCPDYEIREWNEDSFDVTCCDYVREAYEAKKWAFVSDYVRLWAMVKFGGIYMDTDVEVIKSLDDFLQREALSGFESQTQIPTGLMACREGFALFEEFLEDYKDRHFVLEDGSFDLTTNVTRITNICLKYGLKQNNSLQCIKGFTLFPKDYFCPKDLNTLKLNITRNTYAIHHFDGSWLSQDDKKCVELKAKLVKFLPPRLAGHLAKYIAVCRFRGFAEANKEACKWLHKRRKEQL